MNIEQIVSYIREHGPEAVAINRADCAAIKRQILTTGSATAVYKKQDVESRVPPAPLPSGAVMCISGVPLYVDERAPIGEIVSITLPKADE